MTMQDSGLGALLRKAKNLEKKYEWLQAENIYHEAANLALHKKDILNAAELQEKIGFCFYKAAMQAKSNIEYRQTMRDSILAYQKESKLLEDANDKKYQVKIRHAHALTAYVKSRCETNPITRKKLLNRWWTLENQVLEIYENSGVLDSVGKTCNDLSEYSINTRFWLVTEYQEHFAAYIDGIRLAEKAIKIFSKFYGNY